MNRIATNVLILCATLILAGSFSTTIFAAPITIDTSALTGPNAAPNDALWRVLNVIPSTAIPSGTFDFAPGTYVLSTYASGWQPHSFEVLPNGTVAYDPASEAFFSGAGTNTLTVDGLTFNLQLSAGFSPSWWSLGGITPLTSGTVRNATVTALPGTYSFSVYGHSSVSFSLLSDGTISYNSESEPYISGAGTNTLTIDGYPLAIDASALTGEGAPPNDSLWQISRYGSLDAAPTKTIRVLPGELIFQTYAGPWAYVSFNVGADGLVGYAPAMDGVLEGAGTPSLFVRGAEVTIDASPLFAHGGQGPRWRVLYASPFDNSQIKTIRALPGSHSLLINTGATLHFNILADDTVSYDPIHEPYISGVGTDILTLDGFEVTVDASALTGNGIAPNDALWSLISSTWLEDAPVITARLLPGPSAIHTLAGGYAPITITTDGTFQYNSGYEAFLNGQGTNYLTVEGYEVEVDVSLAPETIPFRIPYLTPTNELRPFTSYVVLPGTYSFWSLVDHFTFTVGYDGLIDYDAALEDRVFGKYTHILSIGGVPVSDTDGDGIVDEADNCLDFANADQLDLDDDQLGDACDTDQDGDGVLNALDLCPTIPNPIQTDIDGDQLGDACDDDADGDSVSDLVDNCPGLFNPDQADSDGDIFGDICDEDDDNDLTVDSADNCPLITNADQLDLDSDGSGDACDEDSDGDGIQNESDLCDATSLNTLADEAGCSGAQYIALACDAQVWPNHGRYVNCVTRTANTAFQSGLLTQEERQRFINAAAQQRR
jgi:hypothetical protein